MKFTRSFSVCLVLGSLLTATWSWPAARADEPAATALPTTPPPAAVQLGQDDYELLRLFADTLDQVERNYVQPVDRRELLEAAIRGMLTKLDPHSNYIPPAEIERFFCAAGGILAFGRTPSGEMPVPR